MKSIEQIKNVYFLGIGGIGMSALARYFNHKGIKVSGYDLKETQLTKTLVDEGMDIHYNEDIEAIPKGIDTVVYTPAIPSDHIEKQYLIKNGFELYKRSEVLGWITNSLFSIAIAGTHGKTSTAIVLSYLAECLEMKPYAFLGGIAKNFNANFLNGESLAVVEADEYDRSFLRLFPEIAVITSLDADHLDIYGTHQVMIEAFESFTYQIKDNGALFIKAGLENYFSSGWKSKLREKGIQVFSYGVANSDGFVIEHKVNGWRNEVSLSILGKKVSFHWEIPGAYNIENLTVALMVIRYLGESVEHGARSLSSFLGVKRRFEKVFESNNHVIVDDYAHHPEEIKASLSALRMIYPDKKLTGIFQPHLYSRTRDQFEGFAEALDLLDEVFVLPIYPAREKPIEGITSVIIVEKLQKKNAIAISHEMLIDKLKETKQEIIITLGAGNLERHHKNIIALVKK